MLATPGFCEFVFVYFYGLWSSNSEPHVSKTSALLTEPSSQHTLLLFILVLSKFCSIMILHRVNFSSCKSTANNSTVCLLGLRPGSGRLLVLSSNSREILFSCLSRFASHHLQTFSQSLLSHQRQTAIPILLKSANSEPSPAFPSQNLVTTDPIISSVTQCWIVSYLKVMESTFCILRATLIFLLCKVTHSCSGDWAMDSSGWT